MQTKKLTAKPSSNNVNDILPCITYRVTCQKRTHFDSRHILLVSSSYLAYFMNDSIFRETTLIPFHALQKSPILLLHFTWCACIASACINIRGFMMSMFNSWCVFVYLRLSARLSAVIKDTFYITHESTQ